MRSIQNGAAFIFIAATIVLTGISVLGIWDFLSIDVITKSFETLGLIAFISVVVIVAGKFIDVSHEQSPEAPNPIFKTIRQITLVILIVSVSILALLGIMAIWNIVSDKTVLYKTINSVAILSFSSFIVVTTCLNREK